MATVKLGSSVISLRLTKKNLKQAKERHQVDLSVIDMGNPQNSNLVLLVTDPLYFIEVFFALYEEQFTALGLDEYQVEDLIDNENIEEIRKEFIRSVSGFFPFLRTIVTSMQVSPNGAPALNPIQVLKDETSMP